MVLSKGLRARATKVSSGLQGGDKILRPEPFLYPDSPSFVRQGAKWPRSFYLQHPPLQFTTHPSTSPFTASQQSYLSQHPDDRFQYIATGALVFHANNGSNPRVLLLQRSYTNDSMPRKWEVPWRVGAMMTTRAIMHGVARGVGRSGNKRPHILNHQWESRTLFSPAGPARRYASLCSWCRWKRMPWVS